MARNVIMIIIVQVFACAQVEKPDSLALDEKLPTKVADISLPTGFIRKNYSDSSFAHWLREVPIKKDTRVFLYNGTLKRNQSAQFAVLDVPVGNKDLQQCADAVMRLRAEYLYSLRRYTAISFADNSGRRYTCPAGVDRPGFEKYLEKVFSYCGTISLQQQLKPVALGTIQPGDVLIKGGSPGHAVIVIDVAENAAGNKIYLLAQSYMPAQDVHLLKNPSNDGLSPWYEVDAGNQQIITPEWPFTTGQLRRW
jgi:hypothetical protein